MLFVSVATSTCVTSEEKKINFKDLKIIGVWGGAQQNKKKTET